MAIYRCEVHRLSEQGRPGPIAVSGVIDSQCCHFGALCRVEETIDLMNSNSAGARRGPFAWEEVTEARPRRSSHAPRDSHLPPSRMGCVESGRPHLLRQFLVGLVLHSPHLTGFVGFSDWEASQASSGIFTASSSFSFACLCQLTFSEAAA